MKKKKKYLHVEFTSLFFLHWLVLFEKQSIMYTS